MSQATYIESRLPLEEIGIECRREGSTGLHPPLNRPHVWWARRPLTASGAAVLGALLPSTISDEEFLALLGIKGDPLAAQKKIQEATRASVRIANPFGYRRAFTHNLEQSQLRMLKESYERMWGSSNPLVVDPMAGGGSIPLEAFMSGASVIAAEYNPVAHVILKASLDYPAKFGASLSKEISKWGEWINEKAREDLDKFYPRAENELVLAYIWARTVRCPSCNLIVPLSPNWWLSQKRKIAMRPNVPLQGKGDSVEFDIVDLKKNTFNPKKGSFNDGKASCPRCRNTMLDDYVKGEAQGGRMRHQLCAIFVKRKVSPRSWEKSYRPPTGSDVRDYEAAQRLINNGGFLGSELIPTEKRYKGPADRSVVYGIDSWDKAFNPRQLLTHATYLHWLSEAKKKIFDQKQGREQGQRLAIITYLMMCLDKCLDYNSLLVKWESTRDIVKGRSHDFRFISCYAEMNMTVPDLGFEWALNQMVGAYNGICDLINNADPSRAEVRLGSSIDIPDAKGSVDAVIVDPPYYANVMYAELSDFFYVWMKRILGDLYPGFDSPLTDKDGEIVANSARFRGLGASAEEKAKEDYRLKMAQTFKQIRLILKPHGILVVMFTHKTTEAWDTLATALIDAGFQIRRSWPIRTESEHSLHIAKKNAVKSTILLVARHREAGPVRGWWEQEVYPEIEKIAEAKASEFAKKNIEGVDLYISTFGPVLEVFSQYPEVKSMTGKVVRPEEALDVARKVVTNRTFKKLVPGGATGIDEATKFYILAMHFYRARQFPFDEARKLAISVGSDPAVLRDKQHVMRKKSEDVVILDAAEREHSGYIEMEKPTDKPLVDAIHLAELALQRGGMKQYEALIDRLNLDTNPDFRVALQALSEALPDADPEKRALAPLLLQAPELRAKGSRLEDYSALGQ